MTRPTDPTAQALADRFVLIVSNEPDSQRDMGFMARCARLSDYPHAVLQDALKTFFEETYLDALGVNDEDDGRMSVLVMDMLGVIRDSIDWYALAHRMLEGDFGEEWAGLVPHHRMGPHNVSIPAARAADIAVAYSDA